MFCLYQITNLLNNKYYIGVHCDSANTRYMGSGRGISAAIKKYGKENFKRDILAEHEDKKFIYQLEAAVVNEEFVKKHDNYNLNIGGSIPPKSLPGYLQPNRLGHANRLGQSPSAETRQKLSNAKKGTHQSIESNQKRSLSLLGKPKPIRSIEHCQNLRNAHLGKQHSLATRHKMSVAQKNRRKAERLCPISS